LHRIRKPLEMTLHATTPQNLLVELFVEELPPKTLKKLGDSFASVLAASLQAQGLSTQSSVVTAFASPRRLAAHITQVQSQAANKAVSHKLMPESVGLNAVGEATPALLKKLASLGADITSWPLLQQQIRRQPDGKAEALFFETVASGASLAQGLQKALEEALDKLPTPKVMHYQLADGWTSVNFARPAHGLVALHGTEVVHVTALGLTAGRTTHGHRFEATTEPITLLQADHYALQLETEGAVIASFEARRAEVLRQLQAAAAKQQLTPIQDDALLDEVTALVERPRVLLCKFEPEFLSVPPECLILTMKANQKYFPLLNAQGQLTHQFLVVSNINPADASRVIEGNERVVRPRLADAKFFFDQDRKQTLASRENGLRQVNYHDKLGTQFDRMLRVQNIAKDVAARAFPAEALSTPVLRAAQLAKADLLTDMVGEFPELQGVMGAYYARHDGEAEDVAQAIEDHYKPRFAGDALPRGHVGLALALADKLETLIGMFGIGQTPTGDKDPFALRRHAFGVIRMLVERELVLDLPELVAATFTHCKTYEIRAVPMQLDGNTANAVTTFIYERFSGALREQGFSAQEVEAVMCQRPHRLAEVPKRLSAVRAFQALPEAEPLAAANKRVGNILKKADDQAQSRPTTDVNTDLLREPAEAALHHALTTIQPLADAAFERGDYAASLTALAALKNPVDAFFESVMVNAEDLALRANRLGLLAQLHAAMNRVADLSKLAV
jgi:glycyl-tRNA synthetase beta chain